MEEQAQTFSMLYLAMASCAVTSINISIIWTHESLHTNFDSLVLHVLALCLTLEMGPKTSLRLAAHHVGCLHLRCRPESVYGSFQSDNTVNLPSSFSSLFSTAMFAWWNYGLLLLLSDRATEQPKVCLTFQQNAEYGVRCTKQEIARSRER